MSDRPKVDPDLVRTDGEDEDEQPVGEQAESADEAVAEANDDTLAPADEAAEQTAPEPTTESTEGDDQTSSDDSRLRDETLSNDDLAIERGRAAWERLAKDQTWADWREVGKALEVCRNQAMHGANTNSPNGGAFNKVMNRVLKKHGLDVIHKTTRSHLLKCMDNLAAIEKWRSEISGTQRRVWNHPETVLRQWKAHTEVPDKDGSGSPQRKTKDTIIAELIEKNDKLTAERDMLRSKQGSGFIPGASAKEVADRFGDSNKPDFLRQLSAELLVTAERVELWDKNVAARNRPSRKT